VTDPSGVTYQIQIDDNADFSSPVYSAIDLHDNFDNNEPALGKFKVLLARLSEGWGGQHRQLECDVELHGGSGGRNRFTAHASAAAVAVRVDTLAPEQAISLLMIGAAYYFYMFSRLAAV
jgi:hypothetical protein